MFELKPLLKKEEQEILHRFYDIKIYDNKSRERIEVTEKIENMLLLHGKRGDWDIRVVVDEKYRDMFDHYNKQINVEKLFPYYEKYKDAKNKNGKPFDKIIFTWSEDYDDDCKEYCHRICGVTVETDEEYDKRINGKL